MNLHNLQSTDPVCLTKLNAAMASHQLTYRNVTYHFCSAHCHERFSDNPVFFSAPRRIDEQHPIPKHHRLRIASVPQAIREEAGIRLNEVRGVSRVFIGDGYADIDYDLRLVSLNQVEAAMKDAGLPPKGWLHGLRRSLWSFVEHNELENLASQPSPCCSRPPIRVR
ncbi:YHS domain-containing protein [Dechloromonas hortensis]|uniref:YHS domain-containing protein n=1 Tax=Dechloromonas hortensis TaxID=337779 RepID=UPI001292A126|nr:YHS domain-containing protein [Dechloromonas hortensis]